MVTDEQLRLVLQVRGAEELKALRAEMGSAREAVVQANKALKDNQIDAQQHARAVAEASQRIRDANQVILDHAKAQKELTGAMTSGLAGRGQSMMQLGRFVQDFQAAGITGVTNNIEGMALALGGGAGLAGVLTLLAVGIQLAMPHIQGLIDGFKDATGLVQYRTELERLTDTIRKLESQPIKLAVDRSELVKARRELESLKGGADFLEGLGKVRSDDEQARGGALRDALEQTFGSDLQGEADKMVASQSALARQTFLNNDPAYQKARDQVERLDRLTRDNPMNPILAEKIRGERQKALWMMQRREQEADRQSDRRAQVGETWRDAMGGDEDARKRLEGMAFMGGQGRLFRAIRDVNPENIRGGQEVDAEAERMEAADAEFRRARGRAQVRRRKAETEARQQIGQAIRRIGGDVTQGIRRASRAGKEADQARKKSEREETAEQRRTRLERDARRKQQAERRKAILDANPELVSAMRGRYAQLRGAAETAQGRRELAQRFGVRNDAELRGLVARYGAMYLEQTGQASGMDAYQAAVMGLTTQAEDVQEGAMKAGGLAKPRAGQSQGNASRAAQQAALAAEVARNQQAMAQVDMALDARMKELEAEVRDARTAINEARRTAGQRGR